VKGIQQKLGSKKNQQKYGQNLVATATAAHPICGYHGLRDKIAPTPILKVGAWSHLKAPEFVQTKILLRTQFFLKNIGWRHDEQNISRTGWLHVMLREAWPSFTTSLSACLQGYLTYKKTPPHRTLQYAST